MQQFVAAKGRPPTLDMSTMRKTLQEHQRLQEGHFRESNLLRKGEKVPLKEVKENETAAPSSRRGLSFGGPVVSAFICIICCFSAML